MKMSDQPLVSIIINNYNYAAYVGEAIDSALTQTYSAIEVIVVDDGSMDESREVISKFGSRIKTIYKENGGQSSCFNEGFEISIGEILCFLDADDRFKPEKISTIIPFLDFLNFNGSAWFLAHYLRMIDEQGNVLVGKKPDLLRGYNRERLSTPKEAIVLSQPSQAFEFVKSYGYLPFLCGTTSGSVLSRSLAEKIFPLPKRVAGKTLDDAADDITVSAAMLFAPLYFLPIELTQYRVHQKNIRFGTEQKPRSADFFKQRDEFLNRKLETLGKPPWFSYFDSRAAQPYYLYYRQWSDILKLPFKVLKRKISFRSLIFAGLTPLKMIRRFLTS